MEKRTSFPEKNSFKKSIMDAIKTGSENLSIKTLKGTFIVMHKNRQNKVTSAGRTNPL